MKLSFANIIFCLITAAKEFWAVQKQVAELIKGRILVGHALHNDLKVVNNVDL